MNRATLWAMERLEYCDAHAIRNRSGDTDGDHKPGRRASKISRVGPDAAHGVEQLGLLRHRRHRAAHEGKYRLHGGASQVARLAVHRGGYPVVSAHRARV